MRPVRLLNVLAILLAWLAISCHATEKTTVLVVGDSLSSGYGLEEGESWVDLLAAALNADGHAVEMVNDSISGDTTAGGAARLPAALERIEPDWVIIELGGNDGLRGTPLDAMQGNLQRMVDQALDAGAKAFLLGMKLPPNYGRRYTEGFEEVYENVSAATGAPLLPFFVSGIENDLALFQDDQIHPTREAQPLIMENVRRFLEPYLP